ncbi:MAG: helix-turn-helix domain containing protein [Flammeovirgaceae bacterium]|nr:helix-turn-helix domain containing protein [Flammeovirgaceae bacterium]MDW8287168.1 helix-turn-helix domain-containing protein [Flammeovirgaceae bacterium]
MNVPDYLFEKEDVPTFKATLHLAAIDILLRIGAMEYYRIAYEHSTQIEHLAVFYSIHILITILMIIYAGWRKYRFSQSLSGKPKESVGQSVKNMLTGHWEKPAYELRHTVPQIILRFLFVLVFYYMIILIHFDTHLEEGKIPIEGTQGNLFAIVSMATFFSYGMFAVYLAIFAVPDPYRFHKLETFEQQETDKPKKEEKIPSEEEQMDRLIEKWLKNTDDLIFKHPEDIHLPFTLEAKIEVENWHRKAKTKDEADRLKILLLANKNYSKSEISNILMLDINTVEAWVERFTTTGEVYPRRKENQPNS